MDHPRELDNMRVVDIDYASHMSKYIMAVVKRISPHDQTTTDRKSLIYLFNSKDDSFERWLPFCNISDEMGLVMCICYCPNQSIIYLIMNVFGQSDLVILNGYGTVQDRKRSSDLPLKVEGARLVDI